MWAKNVNCDVLNREETIRPSVHTRQKPDANPRTKQNKEKNNKTNIIKLFLFTNIINYDYCTVTE